VYGVLGHPNEVSVRCAASENHHVSRSTLPKDYDVLRQAITGRLIAVVEKEESNRQNAETVSTMSVVPETSGLAPHELLALTLIFQDHFTSGTPPWDLADSMKKGGYIKRRRISQPLPDKEKTRRDEAS